MPENDFDPFADAPDNGEDWPTESPAPEPEPAPKKTTRKSSTTTKKESNTVAPAEGKIVITHKGGAGFDAPWIVLHLESEEEAASYYGIDNDPDRKVFLKNLMEQTQKASAYFTSLAPNKPQGGGGGSARSGGAPAGAQEHPDGKTEFCEHGKMVFKSGISGPNSKKPGTPYKMFTCPRTDLPRSEQCRPKNA